MTKIILCGYRAWAKEIFEAIKSFENVEIVDVISSNEEYLAKEDTFDEYVDLILFIGWSWIIPPKITERFLCLGIHPSNLPLYRGGSPLQHQIINGLKKGKISLMTLSSKKLDAGEVWFKADLDLTGHNMTIVFEHLVESSIDLLKGFFEQYPNIQPEEQDISKGTYFKRRKPKESKLSPIDFKENSLEDIYNFIRCLTDPYPNAYLEDEMGNKLIFKEVVYIKNDEKS